MVRINLLEPGALSDQHLVAEYHEILLLLGYVRKHPRVNSKNAHFLINPVRYFSDKLAYLEERHRLLREEMKRRGFKPRKLPRTSMFPKKRFKKFIPNKTQMQEIKARISYRLRNPPFKGFYHYYGEKEATKKLVERVMKAKKQ